MKTFRHHLYYLRYTSNNKHGWRVFWSKDPVKHINKEFPPDERKKILVVELRKVI